ncbi:MAG: hypothetical protein P4L73_18060 [Caulobacteraceae bacterium]|nr:hypothetical protein [Caulobacteraceae bacterium]
MALRPRIHDLHLHGPQFHVSPGLASLAAIAGALVLLFGAATVMSVLAPWG